MRKAVGTTITNCFLRPESGFSEPIDLNIQDINLLAADWLLFAERRKIGTRGSGLCSGDFCCIRDIYRVSHLMITPEGGNALFINLNGTRSDPSGVLEIVKGYSEAAKIKGN